MAIFCYPISMISFYIRTIYVLFQDLSQLKSLVERDVHIGESKSAKRLSSAVNRMINNLSDVTDNLHKQKQQLLEEIEVQ